MNKIPLNVLTIELESGSRPKGGVSEKSGSIPSLGAEHLDGNGSFLFDKIKFIPQTYFHSMIKGIIRPNDILIVKDGATTGKISFVSEKFPFKNASINEHLFRLVSDSTKVNQKYLYYFLNSNYGQQQILSDFRGATVGGISRGFLDKVNVPVTSLQNQKRIVAILDKADALRQKRKQALALLDELLRSTFLEMFGDPNKNQKSWCVKEIGEICTVTKLAGFEYTKYVKYSDEGEVIVIRGLNIKEGKLKLDNIHYIDKKTSDLLIRSKLFKNDVVMTYIGVNIGDVAIIDKSNKYHLAPNVAKITPKNFDKLNSIYLMRCLEFNRMQFQKYTTNTAKQALNMGNIRQLKIPIPPIELQTQFAKIVEQTEATKAKMQQSLQELENQFQTLLQRAFKGEL